MTLHQVLRQEAAEAVAAAEQCDPMCATEFAGICNCREAAAAVVGVVLTTAIEAIEALRYESRYMIGGDAEMGESSDWVWRDAALAALEALRGEQDGE
jgi:hypothetical protein